MARPPDTKTDGPVALARALVKGLGGHGPSDREERHGVLTAS